VDVVRLKLVGANAHAEITGVDRLHGIVNYFIGIDPTKWHTNIPTFARIEYKVKAFRGDEDRGDAGRKPVTIPPSSDARL
jgi:hypothetical protein